MRLATVHVYLCITITLNINVRIAITFSRGHKKPHKFVVEWQSVSITLDVPANCIAENTQAFVYVECINAADEHFKRSRNTEIQCMIMLQSCTDVMSFTYFYLCGQI